MSQSHKESKQKNIKNNIKVGFKQTTARKREGKVKIGTHTQHISLNWIDITTLKSKNFLDAIPWLLLWIRVEICNQGETRIAREKENSWNFQFGFVIVCHWNRRLSTVQQKWPRWSTQTTILNGVEKTRKIQIERPWNCTFLMISHLRKQISKDFVFHWNKK